MHALPQTAQWHNVDLATIKNEIAPLGRPAILKGLLSDWPVVQHAKNSVYALCDYLTKNNANKPVRFIHSKGQNGRLFYNEDMSGVNFKSAQGNFNDAVSTILSCSEQESESAYYISSTPVNQHLPTFLHENNNAFLNKDMQPQFWISNQVTVAPHFDIPDNIACCVSGKRKFTLFPPDQISNLYVGPVDLTPAGQPISLVDINNPDYDNYPKFKEALKHAQVAELEPGDALYIPSLWWHNVESLDKFNMLLTYFHDATPQHYGSGFDCLLHGLVSIRNLPESKKNAWKSFFDHYVFSEADTASTHIPDNRLGVLGLHTPQMSKELRNIVSNSLSL